MRKAIVVAAALGILGAATPALAAPPEVQQKSCEANGGTFTRDHGTKTCTTTTQDSYTSDPVVNTLTGPLIPGQGFAFVLTWVSTVTDVVSVTTTQTQKGNGAVTTTQSMTVLSSTVAPVSCTLEVLGATSTEDDDVCAQNGLFARPTPLGPIA